MVTDFPSCRETTDINTVTIKHSPLSPPPSPTLTDCHLIDLWPFRQQGSVLRGMWLTLCLCALPLQVGGELVCVFLFSGGKRLGSEATQTLCVLQVLFCFVFVFSADSVCVFSKESIEERWSAPSWGKLHKKPSVLLEFWPFQSFLNYALHFQLQKFSWNIHLLIWALWPTCSDLLVNSNNRERQQR